MSKRKTNTPAADDAAKGVGTGNQPSVASVNETEGGPSGENGPDGTNTSESDQNGEAGNSAGLADLGQQSSGAQVISAAELKAGAVTAVASSALGEIAPGADLSTATAITAVTQTSHSEASQGEAAEGTGANAGPGFTLDDVLVAAAAENVAQLLHFADIGKRMLALCERHAASFSPDEFLSRLRLIEDASGAEDFEEAMARDNSGPIRVTSARDGFRRAGLVLSKAARTFEPGELTVKQVAALLDDPGITVEYL